MPTTGDLTFEIIDGTSLEVESYSARKIVRAMIGGLEVDSDPDPEVIWRAAAVCQENGFALGGAYEDHENMLIQRIVVRGYTNNGCIADIMIETPQLGGAPSALIIRNRSYLAPTESNMIPMADGTRLPITVLGKTLTGGEHIKKDLASIASYVPMRSVQVSALIYGTLADAPAADYVGYVNSTTWRGKGAGYWLFTEYETDYSRYAGYYTQSASALTRVTHDWSEFSILRNSRDNTYIDLDASDLTALNAAAYTQGLIAQVPGGTRSGRMPMVNFYSLLGII